MSNKLNVWLGKVEHLKGPYGASLKDYFTFFSKSQGSFRGLKKTYVPRQDQQDFPSERENKLLVTTVQEKLDWLEESNKEYLDGLFIVEATNASGLATAELVVDDMNFGTLSSLELLRAINLLESEDLEKMYQNIPVRSDAEIWVETENEMYKDRKGIIYEGIMQADVKTTTLKKTFILKDPNIDPTNPASMARYNPVTSNEDIRIDLGDRTLQHFTGEVSQRDRANILRRRTKLLVAAKEALKKANEVAVAKSAMTAEKFYGYLHNGKF